MVLVLALFEAGGIPVVQTSLLRRLKRFGILVAAIIIVGILIIIAAIPVFSLENGLYSSLAIFVTSMLTLSSTDQDLVLRLHYFL